MGQFGIPAEGFPGALPDAGQVNHPTTGENAPAAPCGAGLEAWCGNFMAMPGGLSVTVLRDVMGENRQRRGRHALAQPAAASTSVFASAPSIAAGRWPGRSGNAGSAASRGAKLCAAGIARRAFPWRQAQRAAPQARRREGLTPNGRDSARSTGRSPKARRRIAPTRPGRSIFSGRHPREVHDHPATTRNT